MPLFFNLFDKNFFLKYLIVLANLRPGLDYEFDKKIKIKRQKDKKKNLDHIRPLPIRFGCLVFILYLLIDFKSILTCKEWSFFHKKLPLIFESF